MTTSRRKPRPLQFDSIDAMRAEVLRIIEADRTGTLQCIGNWSAGQTFGHLATWIEYNYAGYPFKVPAPIRLAARLMKRRLLTKPMRPGIRIPGTKGGTYGMEPMSTDEGARRLRDALDRLDRREPLQHPSPALGTMTLDECVALNLRHAELHLGYLHPTRAGADSL